MKKIKVYPVLRETNEPSHIYRNANPSPENGNCILGYIDGSRDPKDLEQFPKQSETQNQFLYFVCDEKIETNDWFINDFGVFQHNGEVKPNANPKKILTSSDPSLTGVNQLSNYFLHDYVMFINKNGHDDKTYYATFYYDDDTRFDIDFLDSCYKTEKIFDFMQYYMEYCRNNDYITPEDWLMNHCSFK